MQYFMSNVGGYNMQGRVLVFAQLITANITPY